MLKHFSQEDVWCVVSKTDNTPYTRISQYYTREYNAKMKMKQFTKWNAFTGLQYNVMKFTLTEGELIENSNP